MDDWTTCEHEWTLLQEIDDEDEKYRVSICEKCEAYLHEFLDDGTEKIEEPYSCIEDD